ncbi:MAG: AAA family ATPase [Planctomycetaceae bacterium]|nr:AAA family ATPase [Planctomycetales bacterium]MCB9920817.1 AAA family ATPase [Planctomycetaceae bacterium]
MTNPNFDSLLDQFQQAIQDCQQLYLSSAKLCIQQCPNFLPGTPESFVQLMDDLHKGLLIKVYVTVVEADQRWSQEEKRFGRVLFDHIWPGGVPGGQLRDAAAHVFREAKSLNWSSLVRPFAQMQPLHERGHQLVTIVVRLANLVAKADGAPKPGELARLQEIQQELTSYLQPEVSTARTRPRTNMPQSAQAVQTMQQETKQLREQYDIHSEIEVIGEQKSQEEHLAEVMEQLDAMIGLNQVKHEIRTLTNFLRMQRQREVQGLPTTNLSLHLVFGGNPGTGKTTVARIVGQLYGSMGVLSKGHLVETDRSGLVAEYAGQTGPKTNQKVDEALDGVLFVDEAYSLVAESGDDPYGREAVQTLLKRMEDNRDRLVVVLAGYPEEMDRLIRSNPGLSSRFNTKLTFEDYTAGSLGRIFGGMCKANHYVVTPEAQGRLLLGFQWLYDHRDEHFGNGRLVRNVFENAIRRLANRIAGIPTLTREVLTTIEAEDLVLEGVPHEHWERLKNGTVQFSITCQGCDETTQVPGQYLGRKVRCKRCSARFVAEWGEPRAI